MIKLNTPRGLPVIVPEFENEDPSPKFIFDNLDDIKKYYEDNGYVIVKNLISQNDCNYIKKLWDIEIKNYQGYIYRQATAKAEKHITNSNGWIMNPILNLQSIDPFLFPKFRDFATKNFLANLKLNKVFSKFFNDSSKIVQSMYFEGNSATWEHQDSYYLDSETPGEMAAAWIAIEDISATAGRFFICPKSHKISLDKHSLNNNIAENHEEYIHSVVQKIKDDHLIIRAPILNQGDVLFWNAFTIHGSLDSSDPNNSRSSITCHSIPNSKLFLQLQTRKFKLETEKVNETYIFKPKDQNNLKNKLIFKIEITFPKLFYWLKKKIIVFIFKFKNK
jgi:phytanoyl-CoA hydroxylase